MKKLFSKTQLALWLLLCCAPIGLQAQHNHHHCATDVQHERLMQNDARYAEGYRRAQAYLQQATQEELANPNKTSAVYTIPVVFHVIYNSAAENIPDATLQEQLNILNEDFRRMNSDAGNVPAEFQGVTADTEIEFCLASVDPDGNPTTGITRTQTSVVEFNPDLDPIMKYDSTGGKSAWPTDQYLNIWICNLGGGTLGFAQFPADGDYATDGVVILSSAVGVTGASAPNNGGRTGTHEIGHWLNLFHIWGDANCGDDDVADTAPAQEANYGCETHPLRAGVCNGNTDGEMFMNYMDYSDDNCLVMFTEGQKARMRAVLNPGGPRNSLLNSQACGAVSIRPTADQNVLALSAYPNPTTGMVTLNGTVANATPVQVRVLDVLGRTLLTQPTVQANGAFTTQVDLSNLPTGLYVVEVRTPGTCQVLKIQRQ